MEDNNKSRVIKISSDNYDTIQLLRQSGETPNGVVTRLLDEYMQIEVSSEILEDLEGLRRDDESLNDLISRLLVFRREELK